MSNLQFGTIGGGNKIHAFTVLNRADGTSYLANACGSGLSTLAHSVRKPALHAMAGKTAADVTCQKCLAKLQALQAAAPLPADEPAPLPALILDHDLQIGDKVRKFGVNGKVEAFDGTSFVIVVYVQRNRVLRQSIAAKSLQKVKR